MKWWVTNSPINGVWRDVDWLDYKLFESLIYCRPIPVIEYELIWPDSGEIIQSDWEFYHIDKWKKVYDIFVGEKFLHACYRRPKKN